MRVVVQLVATATYDIDDEAGYSPEELLQEYLASLEECPEDILERGEYKIVGKIITK